MFNVYDKVNVDFVKQTTCNLLEIDGLKDHTTFRDVIDRMDSSSVNKLGQLHRYEGLSANEYTVKNSLLWSSLFWKIGEQILLVSNFNSPFSKFYKQLNVGADIEELAPRMKDPIDRNSLSNSALFTNFVTQWDSFYHRINNFGVFATTYDQYEINRISQSWESVTSFISGELANILLSADTYIDDLSKDAFSTQYLSGGIDSVELPRVVDKITAANCATIINTTIDHMSLSPTTEFIPYNRNSNNPDQTIRDKNTSPICLIATAELLNNITFLTALETYFGKEWRNDKFANNVIKVIDFPTTISLRPNGTPRVIVTGGYTPPANPKKILGFLVEENAMIFYQRMIGKFNFDNPATLKTSVFQHLDLLANLSDRRKAVALVEEV